MVLQQYVNIQFPFDDLHYIPAKQIDKCYEEVTVKMKTQQTLLEQHSTH